MIRLLCFFIAIPTGPFVCGQSSDENSVDRMRAQFAKAAGEFSAFDRETQEEMRFMRQSVLNWSNPERNTLAGGLYFWTSQSRPVASLCIYPDVENYDFEFQSLTDRFIEVQLSESVVWQPATAGIVWKELSLEKWIPHKSPLVRRRQMHQIVNLFSAKLVPPGRTEKPLRMQASPVYRYPPKALPQECLEGAVFCFVQGTDPEVLLIIEAVENDDERPVYRYAVARTTMVPLQVHFESELVFEADWASMGVTSPYRVIKRPQ